MATSPIDLISRTHEFVAKAQQDGNFELIDEFMHPNLIDHTAFPDQPAGPAGVYHGFNWLHKVFTDIRIEIMHCIQDDNIVFTHKVLRGRQVRDFQGKAHTNADMQVRIMDVVRFEDGQVIEHWAVFGPLEAGQS